MHSAGGVSNPACSGTFRRFGSISELKGRDSELAPTREDREHSSLLRFQIKGLTQICGHANIMASFDEEAHYGDV